MPDVTPNLGRRTIACRRMHMGARIPRNVAKRQTPITYQELTKALQILPPHSIHRVTEVLEHLMEKDAAADRPFIAALAISRARGGLPAPGFFDCARRLGRFAAIRKVRTLCRFTPPS
jgi:hypothetical protein